MRTFIEATWYTTPMHKACYDNDVDGLHALVDSLSKSEAETQIGQRDHHGWTALHVAVFMNHIEIINVLVSFSVGVKNIPGLHFIRIEI
jgi:ankyrin repeat protein